MDSANEVENVTAGEGDSATDTFDYETEFWFVTGFSVPLSIWALYVCLTQITFCIYKAGWCRINSPNQQHYKPEGSTNERQTSLLNSMSALATTSAFLRAGIDFRLTVGNHNDLGCTLSIKFKLANYVLALLCVYVVLWLRQRIFYQHPRLKHLSSKLIRVVSWSISVVIVIGFAAASVFFFGIGQYIGTPKGCKPKPGPFTSIRWYILFGCTTVFQICLLALFIYPLLKHRANVKADVSSGKENVIITLIRRATISSAMCVTSDIAFALLILFMDRIIVNMSTFVYDVNIVFNATCMVFSFPDWRIRLMPWKMQKAVDAQFKQSNQELPRNETGTANLASVSSSTV